MYACFSLCTYIVHAFSGLTHDLVHFTMCLYVQSIALRRVALLSCVVGFVCIALCFVILWVVYVLYV